ncbi:MAG: IclR family transcriptional regulator [Porticoccaceae bacterium]|nr:IclR family transcriptional regulator [Porticoccaceae bacterium]
MTDITGKEIRVDNKLTDKAAEKPNVSGSGNGSKSIRSVEIGVRVLDALIANNGPMPLRDVAEMSGLSRSQAHRYLAAYVNTGLVIPAAMSGYYGLGPQALRLGLAAYAQLDVSLVARNAIDTLVKETGLTGLVTIWGSNGPTIIRWTHGRPPLATSFGLGSVLSVLSSTAGQVFVSFLQESLTEDLVSKELKLLPGTEQSKTQVGDIPALRKRVRSAGYAVGSGVVIPGLSAISAPILNKDGEAEAVLGLIDRGADRFDGKSPATKQLLKVSAQASRDIGYTAELVNPGK